METVTYTSLRKNLSSILDKIESDKNAYSITRRNHEDIVMIQRSDYESLQETLYLLSNPYNAKHLNESIKQDQSGEYEHVDLDL